MTTSLVHHNRLGALLMVALLPVLLFSACNPDKPVGNPGTSNPLFLIANGSPGRSYLTLDYSTVRGYLKVSAARGLDSRWGGNVDETSLMAVCGDANGNPVQILQAKANGVSLSQKGESNNVFVEDAPQQAIIAGQEVAWDVILPGAGVADPSITFNGSIALPGFPTITNLTDYASYSKSQPLTISWLAGPDPNAEATISIAVDPVVTGEEGGDVSALSRAAHPTLVYTETTNDNGSFTVPVAEISRFPNNVYVRVTVSTFNYQTRARSDGQLYGLIANTQYSVPIKLLANPQ